MAPDRPPRQTTPHDPAPHFADDSSRDNSGCVETVEYFDAKTKLVTVHDSRSPKARRIEPWLYALDLFNIDGDNSGAGAVTVASGASLGGTGSIAGNLNLATGSSFFVSDLFNPVTVTGTVDIYAGFGVANLTGIDDWSLVADDTYTLIDGVLGLGVFDALANNSEASAYDIGGGRIAFFQEGSLQLVVVPEPGTWALLGAGLAMVGLRLARRRSR